MENSLVTFILPTYDRVEELRMALSSLQAQTNPNWKAIVVVDNKKEDLNLSREGGGIVFLMIEDFIYRDERIKTHYMDKRYNDWGHTPREVGKQMSDSQYVVMGGDDSYYMPTFVEELDKMGKDLPGMIYWDMVHSHYDYQYFKCFPAFNQIDIGAFATRTDLAKQIPLGTEYAADGLFVENFKHIFPNERIEKINKVLFVHN